MVVAYVVIFFGIINLLRMTLFIIGSEMYEQRAQTKRKSTTRPYRYPLISVVIPAHNERTTVVRAVRSVVKSRYPADKKEIIVVDNGSTDGTKEAVENYQKRYGVGHLTVLREERPGKANALNAALRNYVHGALVMCLDSDSHIAPQALQNVVRHFQDPRVVAVASNVRIISQPTLLNLIQRFEYLICYQMKRAQTVFNIEYIIGGIGSTFRKSFIEKIGYYDGNTVTEDIDLTMKMLQLGNRENRVIYGADVVAFTESVIDFKGLMRQRYRWKWGRSQTFFKNRNLFYSRDSRLSKWLTWVYLPYALFSDLAFFLEPLMTGYIMYIVIRYADLLTLVSAVLLITAYLMVNVAMESTLKIKEKLLYILMAPSMYFLFYILSVVEYYALLKSLIELPKLKQSIDSNVCGWNHVARGTAGEHSL